MEKQCECCMKIEQKNEYFSYSPQDDCFYCDDCSTELFGLD